ncbi:hypothetical protein ACFLU6_09765 [Acidobacteriota bacterium]
MRQTRLFILLSTLVWLCAAPASPSSLVNAANRENTRRAQLKNQKQVYVLTEQDIKTARGAVSQPGRSDGYQRPVSEESRGRDVPRDLPSNQMDKVPADVKKTGRQMGEYLDSNGNGESYWRSRIASARNRVSKLEARHQKLQSEIPRLRTAFVNMDDPARRQQINTELEAALEESKTIQGDIRRAKADLATVKEEGRRAGALPGWLR